MPSDPFVDFTALSSLGPVQYLDARDRAAFDDGHVPGSLHVPVEEWDKAAKTADIGFINTAHWDDAFGRLGLDPAAVGIAYDDGRMTNAARVWFILQYFGAKAFILNGGWPVLSSTSALPAAVRPSGAGFRATPGKGSVGVVDRQILKRQLDRGEANVLDTRTRAEFTGEDIRNRTRAGHLPGARHLSHTDLLDNGIVRSAPALRSMMEEVGFGSGDHIVTHCEGGGRAALAAAAAVRAGYGDVRVYYLSFADWVRDETCPIVRDQTPPS